MRDRPDTAINRDRKGLAASSVPDTPTGAVVCRCASIDDFPGRGGGDLVDQKRDNAVAAVELADHANRAGPSPGVGHAGRALFMNAYVRPPSLCSGFLGGPTSPCCTPTTAATRAGATSCPMVHGTPVTASPCLSPTWTGSFRGHRSRAATRPNPGRTPTTEALGQPLCV